MTESAPSMTQDANPAARLEQTSRGPLVLLFYDGFEWKAKPGLVGGLYAQGRRLARFLWRNLRKKQVRTGFYTAFVALRRALEQYGCDVRVNDFAAARKRPGYPIGIGGYPSVIDATDSLPNPRLFAPGDFGSPTKVDRVVKDPRFALLTHPSQWFVDYYRPYCGDKPMIPWFAGIDTEAWPDMSKEPKDLDVVVYDKIRWHRDVREVAVRDRVLKHLDEKGLSYVVLRYGQHHQSQFIAALKRAKSMIFLCEHETQGLAYQEAMAANVPQLVWEEKELVDPFLKQFETPGLDVSNAPYFDERGGRMFKIADFEPAFDSFWADLATFRPRDYVMDSLSMRKSAEAYLAAYSTLIPKGR